MVPSFKSVFWWRFHEPKSSWMQSVRFADLQLHSLCVCNAWLTQWQNELDFLIGFSARACFFLLRKNVQLDFYETLDQHALATCVKSEQWQWARMQSGSALLLVTDQAEKAHTKELQKVRSSSSSAQVLASGKLLFKNKDEKRGTTSLVSATRFVIRCSRHHYEEMSALLLSRIQAFTNQSLRIHSLPVSPCWNHLHEPRLKKTFRKIRRFLLTAWHDRFHAVWLEKHCACCATWSGAWSAAFSRIQIWGGHLSWQHSLVGLG